MSQTTVSLRTLFEHCQSHQVDSETLVSLLSKTDIPVPGCDPWYTRLELYARGTFITDGAYACWKGVIIWVCRSCLPWVITIIPRHWNSTLECIEILNLIKKPWRSLCQSAPVTKPRWETVAIQEACIILNLLQVSECLYIIFKREAITEVSNWSPWHLPC
jgi:hypothetical protein